MATKKRRDLTAKPLSAEAERHAVIYARYSSHSQRDVSIEQQVRAVRDFAERQGLYVIDIYADRALTGTSDQRPEFQRMIEASKGGAFAYVIVYSLDRFARDRYDSVVYKRILADRGVRVLSAMENITDDPTGVLLESMLEGLAEYYSRELSTKIRRGISDNASKCLVTGALSYGYRKAQNGTYEIDPAEAEVVREIYTRILEGEGIAEVARSLNERGIRNKRGLPWGKTSFDTILTNERYAGVYTNCGVRIEGGVPAIVSRETFDRMQAHLKNKTNPRGTGRRRRGTNVYLLTGKLYCGECGAAMVGVSGTGRNGLHHYYACKNQLAHQCKKHRIAQKRAESLVARALRDYALQDDVVSWLADVAIKYQEKRLEPAELSLMKRQLKETETAINNLMRAIEQGIITPTTKDRLMELEDRKSDLKAKILIKTPQKSELLTRETIIAAFDLVRAGDVDDQHYQELLFNMFLRRAYLFDDHLKIVFNYTREGEPDSEDFPITPEDSVPENGDVVRIEEDMLHHILDIRTAPVIYASHGLFVLEIQLSVLE